LTRWLRVPQCYGRNWCWEVVGTHLCYLSAIAQPDKGVCQFINAVLGKQAAVVSDGSFSCTRSVESFEHKRKDGLTLTLVDTPGFNDYGEEDAKSDADILRMIAEFLKTQ
jgi:GTPase Era involved in 16S rRNA processing